MERFKSFLNCSCCWHASNSQPDPVSHHAAPSKASLPVVSRHSPQPDTALAPSNAVNVDPDPRVGSSLSASPRTHQVVPTDHSTMQRSDSSSSSCQMIVQRPRPKKFQSDSSAGLPTVSGQLLAQSIASEPSPSTGKLPTKKDAPQPCFISFLFMCLLQPS